MSHNHDAIDEHLERIRPGSAREKGQAKQGVMELLYAASKKRAQWKLRNEASGHSLQTTALTNEALLRLLRKDNSGRDQFDTVTDASQLFKLFATVVRNVLVDHARSL